MVRTWEREQRQAGGVWSRKEREALQKCVVRKRTKGKLQKYV